MMTIVGCLGVTVLSSPDEFFDQLKNAPVGRNNFRENTCVLQLSNAFIGHLARFIKIKYEIKSNSANKNRNS